MENKVVKNIRENDQSEVVHSNGKAGSNTEEDKNALFINAQTLKNEFEWLTKIIEIRFANYFNQESAEKFDDIFDYPVPEVTERDSYYATFLLKYKLSPAERLVLLLSLAPHIHPQVLDFFFTKNTLYDRGFTEFGGVLGHAHSGFLPTGETAMFLLVGDNLTTRFQMLEIFGEDHFFFKHNILRLESEKSGEPLLCGTLKISEEYLTYLTSGKAYAPSYSSRFPAKQIHTFLDWEDLVLEDFILEELEEILSWIQYHSLIRNDWGLGDRIKPGYRTLFFGPPGTGKTLTATLLGKRTGLDVYRIDISQVVSKYIGETEKNLAGVFDKAEYKNWILFFDEADALFGSRTSTKDAKDRYANQEIAYLLQRIEDFPGVVILATNLKSNIDQAFARRFQSMIYFPIPNESQRLRLWNDAFSGKIKVDQGVDFNKIAKKYEVTGGSIINILRYCALAAVRRKNKKVELDDVLSGLRRELRKEGKTV